MHRIKLKQWRNGNSRLHHRLIALYDGWICEEKFRVSAWLFLQERGLQVISGACQHHICYPEKYPDPTSNEQEADERREKLHHNGEALEKRELRELWQQPPGRD